MFALCINIFSRIRLAINEPWFWLPFPPWNPKASGLLISAHIFCELWWSQRSCRIELRFFLDHFLVRQPKYLRSSDYQLACLSFQTIPSPDRIAQPANGVTVSNAADHACIIVLIRSKQDSAAIKMNRKKCVAEAENHAFSWIVGFLHDLRLLFYIISFYLGLMSILI